MNSWKPVIVSVLIALGPLAHAVALAAEKAEPPPTVVVQRGLLRIAVRSMGIVTPIAEVPISARISGEITSLPVELGQVVKKGQKLLEVEAGAQKLAVERAKADLLEAQTQLGMAQMRLAAAERAYRQPPSEGRSAQSTYTLELLRQEVVLREVASSRTAVALESARADLAKTRLVSPMDGVVSELSARRGEFISPSSVESGMHLMTVSDLSKIAVITEIEEGQVRDIQPNLAANVGILAFPERRFQGRIASISPRGQNRGGKTVFPIRIDLEGDPGDAARVGLTANIEIVAIEKPDALLLEIRAIRWVGSGPQVVVLEKGQLREQKVRLGRSDGARVEILEGLREGDQVVLPEVAPPPTAPPPKK